MLRYSACLGRLDKARLILRLLLSSEQCVKELELLKGQEQGSQWLQQLEEQTSTEMHQ